MIAALATTALAWDPCADAPAAHLALGPDLLDLYVGDRGQDLSVEVVDPSWSGAGWDQQALFGVRRVGRCARVGVREQVVWHNVADSTMWAAGRWSGTELHFGTSAMLGAEARLPARFAAGAYALPGLRTVYVHQRADVPERDFEDQVTYLSLVPTLSAYTVLRWVPGRFGVHVDAELPLVHLHRETAWYPRRCFGAGIDLRLGRG